MNRSTYIAILAAILGIMISERAVASDAVKPRTEIQIQACVEEIGLHADYANVSRVIHEVSELNQLNLVALEIVVESAAYAADRKEPVREYSAICVTETMGDLISFRIESAAP